MARVHPPVISPFACGNGGVTNTLILWRTCILLRHHKVLFNMLGPL